MRFADIVLDLAAVVKASRSVASRHVELRTRQIHRYGRTSSIIRSLREDKNKAHEEVDPTSTQPTGDAVNDGQQQPAHDDAPPQSDLVSNTESRVENTIAPDENISRGTKPDVNRYLFERGHSLENATARQYAALQPDRGAILARLREQTNSSMKEGHKAPRSGAEYPSKDDPSQCEKIYGVPVSRGSRMLEQGIPLRRPRPMALSPKPNWFKDFGHDKLKILDEHKGGKPLPSISKASGQGRSVLEESAAAADVAIASPHSGEPLRPQVEDDLVPSSTPKIDADVDTETARQIMPMQTTPPQLSESSIPSAQAPDSPQIEREHTPATQDVLSREAPDAENKPDVATSSLEETATPAYALRESKVPATRLSRIWNYGGLAAGMLGGALTESLSRGFGGSGQGSVMFSAGNMERLVAKLSKMRGAALKLGQMMSFQDSKMLPGPIQEVLQRVQDRADYMPAWQRDRVLVSSLGPEWRDLFEDFEETPIAAASIGQVHRAMLKSGEKVAVKVQFPGVADSINSDLDNISMLLMASGMLPKGLYLDKTIDNARTELGWECDYERELACGRRYKELLADEGDVFAVPEIHARASGKHVLTMQFMEGTGVTRAAGSLSQAQRDWIGTQILRLCLREIVEFRFMQTDPNWTNFLYNAATDRLELLDFGASREFPRAFVARYVALLAAAARRDRDAVLDYSRRLGYLTGHESRAMLDAHVASILTLAEPFLRSAPEVYDFADQTITERVRGLIPVMVRERLSPPPEETYSLHRKLSGAFLLCARLGSRVRCRELFESALEKADSDDVQD
ncbi:ABC1 family-domain-containing protein [Nemania serpens]|nr:ABC1 family-domain-containing protein [Nemania serpens]